MTFSIVAYDPNSGDYGVAVQSKFICVGPVVSFAKAKVGAVATQANANTSFGATGLQWMKEGQKAEEIARKLVANDPMKEHRQFGLVDRFGNAAAFTGKDCFYWAGHLVGSHFTVQGNILISGETVEEMAKAFEITKGDLPDRLLAALSAADQQGRGDARGQQSASLLVVRENGGYGGYTDRWIDLRVDEHPQPIKELKRIFNLYDMTMLEREDPTNLIPIEGEIAEIIATTLKQLNYLPNYTLEKEIKWNIELNQALENWIGINNFENKWRSDGKVWKSIFDYIKKEKGTPYVSLRKMG